MNWLAIGKDKDNNKYIWKTHSKSYNRDLSHLRHLIRVAPESPRLVQNSVQSCSSVKRKTMSLVSGVRWCLPQACLPRWPLTHLRPPCCGFKLKYSLLSHFLANWSWYWRFCKICVSFYPEREIDMNWGKHEAKRWDKARCWRLNRITCCFQKKVGSNFSPQLTWNTRYYQAWKYFKNLDNMYDISLYQLLTALLIPFFLHSHARLLNFVH